MRPSHLLHRVIGLTLLIVAPLMVALPLLVVAPAPLAAQGEPTTIATWNLEWFFDDDDNDNLSNLGLQMTAPSSQEYSERVSTLAEAIATLHPTVLALQEIENANVVQDLADQLQAGHGMTYTVAFVQGGDTFTEQDVAMLIGDGVQITDSGSRFEFDSDLASQPGFRNITKHLRVDLDINGEPYTFITVHLLSSNSSGRQEQARTLRAWLTGEVDPAATVIVLGDFNAGQRFNQTSASSEIGIIRGFQTPATDDDLFDAHQLLGDRATHIGGSELDRILVEPPYESRITSVETRRDLAIRGSADPSNCDGVCYNLPVAEQDLSDHFPLVVTVAALPAPVITPPSLTVTATAATTATPAITVTPEVTVTSAPTVIITGTTGTPTAPVSIEILSERILGLEQEIQALRQEIAEIKAMLEELVD